MERSSFSRAFWVPGFFCCSPSDRCTLTAPSGFHLHSLLADDAEHLFKHCLCLSLKCDVFPMPFSNWLLCLFPQLVLHVSQVPAFSRHSSACCCPFIVLMGTWREFFEFVSSLSVFNCNYLFSFMYSKDMLFPFPKFLRFRLCKQVCDLLWVHCYTGVRPALRFFFSIFFVVLFFFWPVAVQLLQNHFLQRPLSWIVSRLYKSSLSHLPTMCICLFTDSTQSFCSSVSLFVSSGFDSVAKAGLGLTA